MITVDEYLHKNCMKANIHSILAHSKKLEFYIPKKSEDDDDDSEGEEEKEVDVFGIFKNSSAKSRKMEFYLSKSFNI